MNLLHAFILGILQGATEFLPISSSGHLVLLPWLLDWPASSLAFDAVVHWGTAAAVVAYFWRDWVSSSKKPGFFRKTWFLSSCWARCPGR